MAGIYFPKYTAVSASLQPAHLLQPSDPGSLSLAVLRLLRLQRVSSLLCLYEDFIIFPLVFPGVDVL